MTSIIRHELIHAHLVAKKGEQRHSKEFKKWADQLDTEVHCELFTEPDWWVQWLDIGRGHV
jgi:predicted SprT family Zn-dependent metalloprotease